MSRLVGRADWHLRANLVVIAYLIAALFAAFDSRNNGGIKPSWLAIHLLLLGATSNAILTWSDHFVGALLWARPPRRRRQMAYLVFLNGGILGILVGVPTHVPGLVISSATVIGLLIILYLRAISLAIKRSLNRRFVPVIHYYQSAAILILVGILLGVIDTFKNEKDPQQTRIALAHIHANLFGWVGLTIMGTLLTLWPTVLGVKIHPRAISLATVGLRFLVLGVAGTVGSAYFGERWILAISIAIYFIGALITLAPSVLLLRVRRPTVPSAWMLFTGIIGFMFLILSDFVLVISYKTAEEILIKIEGHLLLIFTLWILPTIIGSLIYLLPVVLGRGPVATKEIAKNLNLWWKFRVYLLPVSSFFLLLPLTFHPIGEMLATLAIGIFLTLTLRAFWRNRKSSIAF
jgi:nitrite reductase (NO-forming)